MKKKKFSRRRLQSQDMNLQITSMADIFIIVLVFLLKSYSSGAMTLTPSAGLQLPTARGADSPVEALKVEVTQNSVQIEGKPACPLKDFRFDPKDIRADGSSNALSQALERERKRQLLIAKSNPDVKVDARIIVLSDSRAPYVTVKSVLASSALQGYTDFKLAVAKGE